MSVAGDEIRVEVVFATAKEQRLVSLMLPRRATVADAIKRSELAKHFPAENIDERQAGVWGDPVDRDYRLSDGDRVEIYRSLQLDPREARRQLASMGRTMGGGSSK